MKTLKEIKDEVVIARYNSGLDWNDINPKEQNELWPEVCRRAQLEACKATLEKASEKADVHHDISHPNGHPMIDKASITSEENIVIIK